MAIYDQYGNSRNRSFNKITMPNNTHTFKQFIVTDSKKGAICGSIVTKTKKKNRILIPIDTPKESDFYADFM